jgi:predicted TIM-barrel fold metal-dependent hydrolase
VIVDALTIVGPNLFRPTPGLGELQAAARRNGIDGLIVAPARPFDYALPPANDALAAHAAGLPRIARLGRVDPNQGSAGLTEARRCVRELGCTGLFLHPGEEAFKVRLAAAVLEVSAEEGVPVVIAAGLYGLSEPLQILHAVAMVPEATVILTSGGQINISGLSMIDAWAALERHAGLHVMTNGEYRQDFIERLARDLDPNRVLFASFTPYFDQGYELARVRSAALTHAERALVEGDNAVRLFGLDAETEGAA